MTNIDTYISLGSNLDDPQNHVQQALEDLKNLPNTQLIKHTQLHQTKAVDYLDQPDFINAIAQLKTSLDPFELQEQLQKIELNHGKNITIPKGPRTLDLDILLYDNQKIATKHLTIPHPRIHQRKFITDMLDELGIALLNQ